MTAIYDGTFTSPVQDGAKTVSYPFAVLGDTICKTTRRKYIQVASSFTPTLADRTSYTNLLTYSEALNNAAWTKTRSSVSSDSIANPVDGAVTGDTLLEDASITTTHLAGRNYTLTAANYTFSIYLKAGLGRNWAWLLLSPDGIAQPYCFFDISNGVVGTASGATGAINSVGGGWYRCSITVACSAATGYVWFGPATANVSNVYTGDTSKGIYCFGMQLELASSAGCYASTTSASATVSAPPTDYFQNSSTDTSADSLAYLCEESEMDVTSGLMARFERFYARIPPTQTDYTSRAFNRPNLHDVKSGSSYAVSFDEGKTSTVFSSRVSVSTVGAIGTTGALNADTFTAVDSGGASTTQSMNTAASSLQSAIAAALTALTNITVTQSADVLTISWATGWLKSAATSSTNVTMDAGDTFLQFTAAAAANAAPTRLLTTGSAHGFSVGDMVALWNGDRWVGNALVETAPSGTTFTIRADQGSLALGTVAITYAQKASSGTRYANGVITASCKRVRDFYLPGVTSGISTAADIPLVTVKADPVSWLEAIVAGTAFVPIEVSELQRWAGPIYVREQLQIQMSDALDTVTSAA